MASETTPLKVVRLPIDDFRLLRFAGGAALVGLAWLLFRESVTGDTGLGLSIASIIGATLLLSYRRYVEFDPSNRKLAYRIGFFMGLTRRQFPLGSFDKLALKSSTFTRKNGSETTRYLICIGGIGGPELCRLADMWKARFITEKLCGAMDVSMQNRVFSGSSTRAASELDLPLAERWRSDGKHKEASALPADTSLQMTLRDDYSELSSPIRRPVPRSQFVYVLGGSLLVLGWVFAVAPGARPFAVVSAMAAIGTLGSAILRRSGRNRFRFKADELEFRPAGGLRSAFH